MKSIVLELQHDALDSTKSITDLLRKALVVARKLNLPEFASWINGELTGYPKYDEIPSYRVLHGEIRGHDPFRGWLPVIINNPEMEKKVCQRNVGQAIAELENLVGATRPGSERGSLQIPFTGEHRAILSRMVAAKRGRSANACWAASQKLLLLSDSQMSVESILGNSRSWSFAAYRLKKSSKVGAICIGTPVPRKYTDV
jgi:hypothetical protein